VVSPCVRTFQGLHSVRLWTPTILNLKIYYAKWTLRIEVVNGKKIFVIVFSDFLLSQIFGGLCQTRKMPTLVLI
jgi:hypothetical protein